MSIFRNLFSGIFFTFAVLCCVCTVSAQKIHVITLGSEFGFDGDNVKVIQQDVQNFLKFLNHNSPEGKVIQHEIPGQAPTRESILAAIDSVQVAPEDTLVFYYSGHGAYDNNTSGHYFQIAPSSKQQKVGVLSRLDVKTALLKKGTHLTVLFTDCCNVYCDIETFVVKSAGDARGIGFAPIIDCLFIKPNGVVDITTSSLGEYSFTAKAGSIGTVAFVDTLERINILLQDRKYDNITWLSVKEPFTAKSDELFQDIKKRDKRITQGSQTPWFIEVPGFRFGVRVMTIVNSSGEPMYVKVTEVVPGYPGDKAGIKVGDVIKSIDNKPIRSERDYSDAIDAANAEMAVQIEGQSSSVTVKFADKVNIDNVEGTIRKVTTSSDTPVFGATLNFAGAHKGLVVDIAMNSPAEKCGLEKGDRVIKFNKVYLRTNKDYSDAVDNAPSVVEITVYDHRTRKTKDMVLKLNK